MAREGIPQVEGGRLLLPGGPIEIGSAAWHAWLGAAGSRSFGYRSARGGFTARLERQRNGWYWYAYRRRGGKLRKVYLGRSEDLTPARLDLAATELADEPPAHAAPAAGLLVTKLTPPPVRVDFVPRPRLSRLLDEALRRPVTTVIAPAGSGKTTLVAAWLASLAGRLPAAGAGQSTPNGASPLASPPHVAWLSLDAGDNDPARLWTYTLAAIDKTWPGLAADAGLGIQAGQPPTPAALLTPLLNAISAAPGDVLLVLDDYHLIETPLIHEMLAFLVDNQPPRLRLAILSRADPPLPLARLRARGMLTEIRADALRFTAAEAAAFLNESMGLGLAPGAVAALESRTEGWAAGLQLAALAVRGRADRDAFITSFAGSHRAVADYLVEDVLLAQPPAVQEFLLRTAVLDRMCAELCDALLVGGGEADPALHAAHEMLNTLERANLFLVPLDEDRRWYRYHHLFAEMLRDRLRRSRSDLLPELHRRAAAWFRERNLLVEAIGHAFAAGDHESAAGMIESQSVTTLWVQSELRTLLGWIDAVPPEVRRTRPRLMLAQAWAQLARVRFDDVRVTLRDIEAALDGPSPLPADQEMAVLSEILAIRSFVARVAGDMHAAFDLARRALEHLPQSAGYIRGMVALNLHSAHMMLGDISAAERVLDDLSEDGGFLSPNFRLLTYTLTLGWMRKARGRLHEALALAEQALREAEARGLDQIPAAGMLYVGIAEVRYEWNDLDAAERLARQAIAIGDRWWNNDILVQAYAILGNVLRARTSPDADAAYAELGRLSRSYNVPWVDAQTRAGEAHAAISRGDLSLAERWFATADIALDDDATPVRAYEYMVLMRVAVATGRAAEALPLQERLLAYAEAGGYVERAIDLLKIRALALDSLGRRPEALEALWRALVLGEPGGYQRVFLDEGEPLRRLLAAALGSIPTPEPRRSTLSYARRLLAAFPPAAQPGAPRERLAALPEPLTEREVDVLRLIAAGRSTAEIADALVVAVSTVRTHVKNLYGKLGASSRVQVVEIARSHGLLAESPDSLPFSPARLHSLGEAALHATGLHSR